MDLVEGEYYLRKWATTDCDPVPCWVIVSFKTLTPMIKLGLPIQSVEASITVKVLVGSQESRNVEVLSAIKRLLEVLKHDF